MTKSQEIGLSPVLDVEERIRQRRKLSDKEVEGVVCSDPEKRRKYFFSKIVDSHEIWTVWDSDELPTFTSSRNDLIYVWPAKEFADAYNSKSISNPRSVPIPIDDFIDEILYSEEGKRELDVGIFPVNGCELFIAMGRDDFIDKLLQEWRSRSWSRFEEKAEPNPGEDYLKKILRQVEGVVRTKPKPRLP